MEYCYCLSCFFKLLFSLIFFVCNKLLFQFPDTHLQSPAKFGNNWGKSGLFHCPFHIFYSLRFLGYEHPFLKHFALFSQGFQLNIIDVFFSHAQITFLSFFAQYFFNGIGASGLLTKPNIAFKGIPLTVFLAML